MVPLRLVNKYIYNASAARILIREILFPYLYFEKKKTFVLSQSVFHGDTVPLPFCRVNPVITDLAM